MQTRSLVPPSASQLRTDCQAFVTAPGNAPGARGEAYIQGFLERETYPPRASAAICVTASVSTAQVVAEINAHLDANPPAAGDSAATVVHAALLASYPCKPAPR